MLPLTLLATDKLLDLLTVNSALSQAINSGAAAAGVSLAPLVPAQVYSSFVSADMGDLDLQLSYPRVFISAGQISNGQREKFRSFSGTAAMAVDVWSSASMEQATEVALHFYVGGITSVLTANIGDLGNGCRYSGIYEVKMGTPKAGGLGFVQSARLTCNLEVSFS